MKKDIRLKCIFFVGLLTVSSLVSLISPFVVSAASAYDRSYQTTSDLYINHKELGCNKIDISKNWASYITNKDNWKRYYDGWENDQARISASFKQALLTGSWAVSLDKRYDGEDTSRVLVYWKQQGDMKLKWSSNYTYVEEEGVELAEISCQKNPNPLSPSLPAVSAVTGPGGSDQRVIISQNPDIYGSNAKTNYIFTGDPNYPTGYGGVLIQDIAPNQNVANPKFDYDVARKDLTITFKPVDIPDKYKYLYTIVRLGDVNGDLVRPDDGEEILEKLAKKDQIVKETMPKNGTYLLGVGIVPEDYSLDEDNYRYVKETGQVWLDLDMDDTTFYSGSSDDSDHLKNCVQETINKQLITRCEAAPLQVCHYENLGDLIPFITCQISNFITSLLNSLKVLFIPEGSYVSRRFGELQKVLNEKLGVLIYPFAFFAGVLGSLVDVGNSSLTPCSTMSVDNTAHSLNTGGKLFGGSFSPNFCDLPNKLPRLWTITTIIIQVVTIFAVVTGWYRMFFRTFGAPPDQGVREV